MRNVLAAWAILVLSGCTYPVAVSPTIQSAAEVAPNRTFSFPATYSTGPDFISLDKAVRSSTLSGSAHTFTVALSSAFAQTLEKTLAAAYSSVSRSDAPGKAPHHYRFDIEDSEIEIAFLDRFLTVASAARVSIVLRIRVLAPSGQELSRALAQGSGRSTLEGGLNTMQTAIQQAAERAMRSAATDFVYKVINTGALPTRP